MSVLFSLYIGPHAQWLVKKRVDHGALRALLEANNGALYSNALGLSGEPPEVQVKRARRLCYCFIPDTERPDQPRRQLWFTAVLEAVEDLTEVERKVEMDWFASAFAGELQALADFFGEPATIRWGLVAWAS
jgi:hypothetical protein